MATDTERQHERDKIRAALSEPWRVAELLGLTEGAKRQARGVSVRCPLHPEKNASCSITTGDGDGIRVRCFVGCDFGGANRGGDVFSLVAAVHGLDPRRDFGGVLQVAADLAGVALSGPRIERPALRAVPSHKAPPHAPSLQAHWDALESLDADAWDYLRGRGLEAASTWCKSIPVGGLPVPGVLVGKDAEVVPWAAGCRFAVALRDVTCSVVGIQARNIETGKAHDFRVLGASSVGMFGEPHRVAGAANVVVCEGLTDTLAALIAFANAKSTAVVGVAGIENAAALDALSWKGKRVFLAFDADEPDTIAATRTTAALERLTASITAAGGKAIRLRPEGGKDLAEMHAAGVDLYEFAKGAVGRNNGFRTVGERARSEHAERMRDAGKDISFAVRLLDRALGAIMPRDDVLIGADSGVGKTDLATLIGMTAAMSKKRVHYYALEPEPLEIERRIKFKFLSRLVHAATGRWLHFQEWWQGRENAIAEPFEDKAAAMVAEHFPRLHTFYRHLREGQFTPEDFDRIARAITEETDLHILDHVHYFDDGDNANRSQKALAQNIRSMAVGTGRPVVQMAHLRKNTSGGRKGARLMPEMADFEGSSHLFKAVKRAIILAPAFDQKSNDPLKWPTYFAIVKNTYDSSRTRFVGLVDFNQRTNSYDEEYRLGRLVNGGTKWEEIPPAQYPYWAQE